MSQTSFLRVGRIVATHGLRGEVRVLPITDYPETRFAKDAKLILHHDQLHTHHNLVVESSRPHKNVYLVKFVGCADIDTVLQWIGGELSVHLEEAVPSSDDEFYYHEIIDCQVITTEGKTVGKIIEIIPNPANDIWVVKPAQGKPIYLPYIQEIVKEVDPVNKQIMIEWMEGLD